MKLAIIDFETDGVDPSKNQVLEVGACLFDVERVAIVRAFSMLARAESNAAEHVNRIPPELLLEAKPLDAAWWKPVERLFADAAAVTAWCADFDRSFTPPALAETRVWFDAADLELPRAGSSRSLADAVARHGVPSGIAHRALADVLAVAALLTRADELHRLGESKWSLREMIDRALAPRVVVVGDYGFDKAMNDEAKKLGFAWDQSYAPRKWSKRVLGAEADAFVAALPFRAKVERPEVAA